MIEFPRHLQDKLIKIDVYKKADLVCNRFSKTKWSNIISDISSDVELQSFISSYDTFIFPYVIRRRDNNEDLAFLYMLKECRNTVSIHGGGWKSPLLYVRGYILMLNSLIDLHLKGRTKCALSNISAIKLNKGIGFRPYKYTEDSVYMWINCKTLKNSKIYKRFHSY